MMKGESIKRLNGYCIQKRTSFSLNYGRFSNNPFIEEIVSSLEIKSLEIAKKRELLFSDIDDISFVIEMKIKNEKKWIHLFSRNHILVDAEEIDGVNAHWNHNLTETFLVLKEERLVELNDYLLSISVSDEYSELSEWIQYLDIWRIAKDL